MKEGITDRQRKHRKKKAKTFPKSRCIGQPMSAQGCCFTQEKYYFTQRAWNGKF